MINDNTTLTRPTIGLAVYNTRTGDEGHIVKIETPANVSHVIGLGGMARVQAEVTIVWNDLTIAKMPDAIAADYIESAARYELPAIGDNATAELLANAVAKQEKEFAERKQAQDQKKIEVEAYRAQYRDKIPAWAKSVIVAELRQDVSDTMSDYWNSRTVKSIVLGFSKHTRDLFPEMRQAARNHPDTAHLADAPESAEHREKYSMGGGFYLKTGSRHSDGWKVSKRDLYEKDKVQSLPFPSIWAVTDDAQAIARKVSQPTLKTARAGNLSHAITIEKHMHTKKGFEMFMCILPDRVERDEYLRLLDVAKSLGGWYSKPWGKTPGGFAFKELESAESFCIGQQQGQSPVQTAAPKQLGAKFAAMADQLQTAIDDKLRDRLTNTPKRQRQACQARLEGLHLERAQKAMRALASLHDAGTVPEALRNVQTKAEILELSRSVIERTGAYYDAGRDTGKPRHESPEALAVWELIGGSNPLHAKAESLRTRIEQLQFADIPSYFPTPRSIIEQMIEFAQIPPGVDCTILEPSAGHGAIIDALAELRPMASVFACEVWGTLRDILKDKGANLVGHDFEGYEPERQFDFALMNPPFERGQDAAHVMRAFEMLKPGGRLVSVMSPGPFFRSDRKSQEFRDWFSAQGGDRHDLPKGSFKQAGTSVDTVLVVIEKTKD
ncbi:MAG: class I SAM-dependent methyltransferase [Ahrensia sp.]|nr:class I SAM-dependent methyltransferase [Ahrensia sp.]